MVDTKVPLDRSAQAAFVIASIVACALLIPPMLMEKAALRECRQIVDRLGGAVNDASVEWKYGPPLPYWSCFEKDALQARMEHLIGDRSDETATIEP
ncbi:hypothetical protein [Microbacterium rhizomatis]|uniref:Uncharacterized protein n=1 Tax=Microbacterium rhizomatis TaxID=1631477 RepID=A0A5J5IZE0_9MICO|nr:hypothetical protein [Microbacterium rhizomatis]KAA9104535.1 hypothetical protein F6B43_19400 [Microbacterium rhizomatis]